MPVDFPHHQRKERRGVFISYARSDGEAFATRLRERLEAEDVPLWQDRVGMEGGYDWWLQIEKALMQVEFMVMVMTPAALDSKIVRKEWRYARQQGVCVYPVKGAPNLNFGNLPRWMRNAHFYDLGLPADDFKGPEWKKFLNDLNTSCQTPRVPFMAEDLPEGFVERPEEFNQLISLLLDQNREEPVAITAALRGAGGYGKTTMAIAICHHEDIQNAFDDGILWVTLSENLAHADLIGRVEDLIHTLSGERPGFAAIDAAKARLAELLENRDILMVIDNVWNRAHLDPFLRGGPRCARLITTRKRSTLPADSKRVDVDAMRLNEAITLLGAGLSGREEVTETLYALTGRLGRWPQLLGLVNGVLRRRVTDGESLIDALAFVNDDLEENGLTTFDESNEEDRRRAVNLTLNLSLKHLTEEKRYRFFELAIFPENKDIPLATVHKLWDKANGYSRTKTEKLCDELFDLSLLQNLDLKTNTIKLHDVIRTYLIEQQRDQLPSLHSQLLDAHRPAPIYTFSRNSTNAWANLPPDEPYLWDHLVFHLVEARSDEELMETVKDWQYLAKKTLMRKSLAVESDLLFAGKRVSADEQLQTLRRSFANSGHILNRCATIDDIKATFFVRLWHLNELRPMLQNLAKDLKPPYIALEFDLPDLPHPALIRTLESHLTSVRGCNFTPDCKLIVSSSADGALKVWHADSGEMIRTLTGHSGGVWRCTFSPDGKLIASVSEDHTLRVWDTDSGEMLLIFAGHSLGVDACSFSPDGKLIVSASDDCTLILWDTHTGKIWRSLQGHSDAVWGCDFSPDGKQIISASTDNTLKVWDTHSGNLLRTLEGHSASVCNCTFSPDGKLIVSASDDCTLILWDTHTGKIWRSLQGHSDAVWGCDFSPDGSQIVSASSDRTLKIWDADSGKVLRTLEGHSGSVNNCTFSPDGRLIVSASSDRTLKVWDAHADETTSQFKGHSDFVWGAVFSPDGKLIVSTSEDKTLELWDAGSGKALRIFEDHLEPVLGCCINPANKLIVSASADRTLKIWDMHSGEVLRTLIGHSLDVNACGFSPDGKFIVSASNDRTLRIWDSHSGETRRILEGHTDFVRGCTFSPDGKLVISASDDLMLKVWDAQSGELLRTFAGHLAPVRSCGFSQDGAQIISASDDWTLKIWDAHSGELLNTLEGHSGPVWGCRFSSKSELIVSASSDHTLKVWDTHSDDCLATFYADGKMFCCAMYDEAIVAGGERGVYFLKLVRQIEEDGSSVAIVESDEKTDEAGPGNSAEGAESARPRESLDIPQNLEALSVRESEMPPPTEPQQLQRQSMIYASTFLSHNSADKELVHAVARELGQRGILAWLDANELHAGLNLSSALAEAVQRQATLTAFLSLAAVKSGWVERELKAAFEMEKELGIKGRILPVFLDDPEIVVKAHDLLREHWLDESRRHVNMLGILSAVNGDDSNRAKEIAGKIARSIYRTLELEKKDEVVIYLDQRGEGQRRGEPPMPPILQNTDAPVLVFRPDLGRRTWSETLTGSAWEEFRDNIKDSLSEALGTLRVGKRKIYLAGLAQLGLAYLIGKHFARNTETELHCVGRNEVFTSTNQPGTSALSGGNPHCETSHAKIPPLPEQSDLGAISLLLCKVKETDERFIDDPLRHIKATPDALPTILVKHDDPLTNSVQVMIYIANVVALLQRLRSECDVRAVNLYTSLPFHAVPLLASNLHPYVVDSVRFMEYRSDLREQSPIAAETYSRLSF